MPVLDQRHSCGAPNSIVPVLVSTDCPPDESSTAVRPVTAFLRVMRAGPTNVNFSAEVCTCLGDCLAVVTCNGKPQSATSTRCTCAAERTSAAVPAASTPECMSSATLRQLPQRPH